MERSRRQLFALFINTDNVSDQLVSRKHEQPVPTTSYGRKRFMTVFTATAVGLALGIRGTKYPLGKSPEYDLAVFELETPIPTPTDTHIPQPTDTPTPIPKPEVDESTKPDCRSVPGMSWTGKASYYSEKGCLRCSPNLTMANGQRLNDQANTLSFMEVPLNSRVSVINLDNGRGIEAVVTDRGGFKALGRIADLSKGLAERVGLKTDVSLIKVSLLNCSK